MFCHKETSQLTSLQIDCLVLYDGSNDGEWVNGFILNKKGEK